MLGRERRLRNTAAGKHETEQMRLHRRSGERADAFLPRRSGERPLAGGGRRVVHAALGLRRVPEPQEPGQRAGDDLSDGMLEVVAGPQEQLERRLVE